MHRGATHNGPMRVRMEARHRRSAAEIHIPRKNALDTAATWKSIL